MSKKVLRTLIAVLLVCSLMSFPTAFAESAVVTGSNVNLRSGPGTSYKQIGSIPDATKVGAVAKSDGGKWYLVYYDGKFGWVSSGYLTTNLNYATASPSPAQ